MFSSLLDAGRRNHWLSVKDRKMVSMHDTSLQRGYQHYNGQDPVHMHVYTYALVWMFSASYVVGWP